jgi:hypothetical protein
MSTSHPFGSVIDMPYAYDPDPPRLRPKPVPSGEPAQPEGRIEDE